MTKNYLKITLIGKRQENFEKWVSWKQNKKKCMHAHTHANKFTYSHTSYA